MSKGIWVQYPYKTETRTEFVMFLGTNSKGKSKFSFVGKNNQRDNHAACKNWKRLLKTINNAPKDKTIKP